MEITYKSVTGENIKVSVAKEFESVMMQMEKDLYNNNHKETRRHQSLSEMIDKSDMLIDKRGDLDELIFKKSKVDKLYEAISKLKPAEQELIHKLYLCKHPMTQAEYARSINISDAAMWKKVQRIRDKLKKLI